MFRDVVGSSLSYKDSKTNREVLTVRHAINILRNRTELEKLTKATKHFKHSADIDQDDFVDTIDNFIDHLSIENVVETAVMACTSLSAHNEDFATLSSALETFGLSVNECLSRLSLLADEQSLTDDFYSLTKNLKLYSCAGPKVLLASNYGVPQDRRRVVFIGCRNDVPLIDGVPPSLLDSEKVTVSEAISDLDTLESGEKNNRYLVSSSSTTLRTAASMFDDHGLSYSEWSRRGRVPIKHVHPPTFFKSIDDYHEGIGVVEDLHNHEASNHNATVVKRYSAMVACGDYDSLKGQLDADIASEKRDYSVLKPDGQSPTVLTIADDFVHYRVPRAITVREMARLQSFDDSFVFQGKRTTGGHRRKEEIPQCTLVGNAVPPLMARAIADVLRKNLSTNG
jgi:DNA (cytosine-5)-methyltransferase 1